MSTDDTDNQTRRRRFSIRDTWYQQFARFARDWSESEACIDPSGLTESSLVKHLTKFLDAHYNHLSYEKDKFQPEEFNRDKIGGPKLGGPKLIDVVGYRKVNPKPTNASLILEAKLMMNPDSVDAKAILTDILRVAVINKNITPKADRLMVVGGQRKCWEKLRDQCGRVISKLCPMDHVYSRLTTIATCGLRTRWRVKTYLNDSWKHDYGKHIEEYLRPLLPNKITVQLYGLAESNRRIDENPEEGIDVRIWRVRRS